MWQRAITFNLALILTLPVALHAADGAATGAQEWRLPSPDEKVVLTIRLGEDEQGTTRLSWRVELAVADSRATVLPDAPLGIVRQDQRFVENLAFVSASPVEVVDETYTLPHGKQSRYQYRASERRFVYRNPEDALVEVVARVFNDAVAMRYRSPETREGVFVITES